MKIFFALLAICAGNSPVTGEFPAQRPVTLRFDAFFDLCLNKRLSKSRGWWFETPSHPSWRHCNAKKTVCITFNILNKKSVYINQYMINNLRYCYSLVAYTDELKYRSSRHRGTLGVTATVPAHWMQWRLLIWQYRKPPTARRPPQWHPTHLKRHSTEA